jgi:hypothetical protein
MKRAAHFYRTHFKKALNEIGDNDELPKAAADRRRTRRVHRGWSKVTEVSAFEARGDDQTKQL